MMKWIFSSLFALSLVAPYALGQSGSLVWHDAITGGVEGKGWQTGLAHPYDRLPARAEKKIEKGIWDYSRHSAGLSVRFLTDATEIHVRYRLVSPKISAFADVSGTATSGVDLYAEVSNKAGQQEWRWIGANKPRNQDVTDCLAKGLAAGRRLYQLNLPLYNGIEKLEIGVPENQIFQMMVPRSGRPILFYGTSITQGGVASRPGLAFPSILGRRLNRPILNLGFCGYGRMEPELAEFLAELDPCIYVIDALQNMKVEQVEQRAAAFILRLRETHPDTPILLVGFGDPPTPSLFPAETSRRHELNDTLHAVFRQLQAAGCKNLHYLPGPKLLGTDGEATGDGLHPNAIGHMRYADAYEPVLRSILETASMKN